MMFLFKVTFCTVLLIVDFCFCYQTYSENNFYNTIQSTKESRSLEKRSVLTFPPSSLFQINMGITLAGQLERNSAVVVLAMQQNIPLPEETQPFLPPSLVVTAKKFAIYDHLRDVVASYGFNGSECLRKMVCQIGETPLLGGLLEDVITFVLSPSKHRSIDVEEADLNYNLLLQSEQMGKLGGNCSSAFPECVQTPLDFISAFFHV